MTTRTIIISDVDGTLVRGSLVLNHAVKLHEMGVIDLGPLPALWRADMKNEDLIKRLAEAYRTAIVGKTAKELYVDTFIADLVADPKNFYSSLQRLVELKEAGAEVVLISGSPNFLVERFGKHFGFSAAASKYRRDRSRRFTGECRGMFTGDAKKRYISRMKLADYGHVMAFGDTESDAPLFAVAHHSVLVDPNGATHATLAELVHEIILD
jgi:HAD superfamily phosphoserine phosphatase-like hydrolase